MRKCLMLAAASAALLGSTTVSVNAAPANSTALMKPPVQVDPVVDQIAYRCWWRDGERFCSRRAERGYGYDYGRPRPEAFPFGSTAWWRARTMKGGAVTAVDNSTSQGAR